MIVSWMYKKRRRMPTERECFWGPGLTDERTKTQLSNFIWMKLDCNLWRKSLMMVAKPLTLDGWLYLLLR